MIAKKFIYRDGYFKLIEPFIGDSLIKVLIGQRRVGKSYILYQIIEELRKINPLIDIIYIDKEDFAFDNVKNYIDLISYVESNRNTEGLQYLFIDEIQEINNFEKALRHFQSNGNFDIYCTGSNATLLSGEIATLLAGRYIQIRVYSLSFSEFLIFHNLSANNDSLQKYILFGGMPHLINLKNDKQVYYEYLRNMFDSIILRDIVTRFNIRNVNFLQDLILFWQIILEVLFLLTVLVIILNHKKSIFYLDQYLNI